MIVVIWAGGVIGIALHQHQLLVDLQNGMHCLLHFANRRGAGSNEERFALAGHTLQGFDPVDFTGTGLVHLHVLVEIIDRFKIVGG